MQHAGVLTRCPATLITEDQFKSRGRGEEVNSGNHPGPPFPDKDLQTKLKKYTFEI